MICPVCKCEPYEFYLDINGDICGCDSCITCVVKADYEADWEEGQRDYHREMFMSNK